MRKKVFILFFIISICISGSLSCFNSVAQNHFSQEQITQMLKNLYTNIAIICSDPYLYSLEKIDSIKRLNCTANYYKEIKDQGMLDYDPLLKAQDFRVEYLKTLTIRKDLKREDLYYVSYITPYDNMKLTIKLIIVKEKESYKIESVFLDGI
jgi:hypothetical protein